MGGGLEGAERTQRETALWNPHMGHPDQIINRAKPVADARGRDLIMNDPLPHGAVAVHKDSIVGSHYRLNATPDIVVLKNALGKGFDETWAEEFQTAAEHRFNLIAESDAHFMDAAGRETLTGMIRLAVGGFVYTGEVLETAEWFGRDRTRPCKTAVQMVSPGRLCNKDNGPDTRFLKRGVRQDRYGRPLGYWIKTTHPRENLDEDSFKWSYIDAYKPWGRPQVLHIREAFEVAQTRGVADMVAALSHMRMTKNFKEIALQNAVVQASYAAALEADMPPDIVYGTMGANDGRGNFESALGAYTNILQQYFGGANNVAIDGARIPILPPGVKLNAKTLAAPGGVGSNFQESLERATAAALGLSYEEFSRDFSKVSYSSARASMGQTGRFMKARKKVVADRAANFKYGLWLEEDLAEGNLPLPRGIDPDVFYEPLMRQAFSLASWIGAGAGQIDELKETQAAILRIKAGLSTYEKEIARFGDDWRDVFAQQAREAGVRNKLGLGVDLDASRPNAELSDKEGNEGTDGESSGEEDNDNPPADPAADDEE